MRFKFWDFIADLAVTILAVGMFALSGALGYQAYMEESPYLLALAAVPLVIALSIVSVALVTMVAERIAQVEKAIRETARVDNVLRVPSPSVTSKPIAFDIDKLRADIKRSQETERPAPAAEPVRVTSQPVPKPEPQKGTPQPGRAADAAVAEMIRASANMPPTQPPPPPELTTKPEAGSAEKPREEVRPGEDVKPGAKATPTTLSVKEAASIKPPPRTSAKKNGNDKHEERVDKTVDKILSATQTPAPAPVIPKTEPDKPKTPAKTDGGSGKVCSACGGKNVIKFGIRNNRQVWLCKTCRHRMTDNKVLLKALE